MRVVEVITGWYVGRLIPENRRKIRVFAVVIKDVGDELPLLQHVGAARQVSRPGLGYFRPGLMPGEPLAVRPQPEPRYLVRHRLMHRGVDHEAVQPERQL